MKTFTLLLLSILLSASLSAESFIQKGQVLDQSGEPIIGVSVVIKGTTSGTVTDVDGNFSITVSDKYTLVFSYLGMLTQEYKVDSKHKFVKITMQEDSPLLDEVVVTGYGTVSKKMITGSVAGVSVKGKSSKGRAPKPSKAAPAQIDDSKVGLLTAGELNDFSKWMMWDSIANKVFTSYKTEWKIQPLERYVAQLTNLNGMPIVNATVILADKNNNSLWEAKTDNTGRAELWANIFGSSQKENASTIYIEYAGIDSTVVAKLFSEGINTVSLNVDCNKTRNVDIMMIVDATGSMADEIRYLQNELHDIINKIQKEQKDLDIRIGSVFYRDKGDEYLTRKTPLDKDVSKTIDFIQAQSANGGGDYPEAVDEALYQSIEQEAWREDALTRVAFLVLDAPAHNDAESIRRIHEQVKLASQKGIRIIPIVCSGIDKSGEYLMRSMALATNGTYVFLTDDSGIGNAHIKPSTDKWDVETLNNLMIRLITQYTQMPDCENSKWEKDYAKSQENDKFVPNPYDENQDKNASKIKPQDVMKVYPNPCSDILKVDIKQKDVKDLYLVDISGKLILKLVPEGKETIEINVKPYSSGVYFVKSYYKGRWFTEKIIIR